MAKQLERNGMVLVAVPETDGCTGCVATVHNELCTGLPCMADKVIWVNIEEHNDAQCNTTTGATADCAE